MLRPLTPASLNRSSPARCGCEPAAGRGEGQAIRLRFAVGDQFGKRLERRIRADDQEQRRDHSHRDGLQILALIGQLAEQRFGGRVGRRDIEEGIAVARRMRDRVVGDAGAGARLVLYDELLVQVAAELFGQQPQRDVVGAAGPVRRDQPHHTRRPGVLSACGEWKSGYRKSEGAQKCSPCDGHGGLPMAEAPIVLFIAWRSSCSAFVFRSPVPPQSWCGCCRQERQCAGRSRPPAGRAGAGMRGCRN
ncbi:hypothetical protein ACVWZK_004894 [Bradyrhizobium sp. GM0.4]